MSINDWKVLVIEDENDSLELVQGLLSHHGIHSYGASTAEEALEMLNNFEPNLIISDLALPGLDGWQFLKQIKRQPRFKNVPCVAMTAYHTAELAEQAIEAGFVAYFPKPLDASSFVRELANIVEG